MKSFLFLVLVSAAVRSEIADINLYTDLLFASINHLMESELMKITSVNLPASSIKPSISFSESLLTGLNSLKRTGNNTALIDGNNTTYDIHLGLGLLQQSFQLLTLTGNVMSGGYRVRDNSLHLAFTRHQGTTCNVTLEDIHIERLANVEFFSSKTEFDGGNVESIFAVKVVPFLNNLIKGQWMTIEGSLQDMICDQDLMMGSDKFIEYLKLFLMPITKNV
nr:uncharacterized protein LOC106691018 [Halyomorpha halys]